MPTGFANTIINPKPVQSLEYRQVIHSEKHKHVWKQSSDNNFGRLMQGIRGRVKGNDCIHFIHRTQTPKGKENS